MEWWKVIIMIIKKNNNILYKEKSKLPISIQFAYLNV